MDGGLGADVIIGGTNPNDTIQYFGRTADLNISLDDVANDGESGEGDDVRSTVEDVGAGSGNDTITGSASDNAIFGNSGNDDIVGGAGDDVLDGDLGGDTLNGQAGNDFLVPAPRPASASTARISSSAVPAPTRPRSRRSAPPRSLAPIAISITLDDVANDGISGENDNYTSDIEDVSIDSHGDNTIVGTAAINILRTNEGNDVITGGNGNDILSTLGGNDTINARDGFADRVDCGPGTDTAVVDTLDDVLSNCEIVQAADVGNANEDGVPTVAFVTPAENALLPGGPSAITVNAADDKGIARVVLIDDGAVVGVDTTAPYAFAYQPKATDIGKNVLIAQAVDVLNQTATAIRTVRVDRFNPARVSQTVAPSRDRARPYRFRVSGAVTMPAGVTKTQGCKAGTVTVTAKIGTRTRFTRECGSARTARTR